MKHYEALLDLGCFTRNEINELLGNEAAAHSLLYDYTNKGLIERVRRDLYVAISLETKQPVVNRYAIASHITEQSYISHHSAFEYYGFANQVYYEVYVCSNKKFSEFEYDGIEYKYTNAHIDEGIITQHNGIKVTDIERTILDSINDFERISGLEELLKCIEMIISVDENKLIHYLAQYNRKKLYQRTGYILQHFKDRMLLSDAFFEHCRSNITEAKQYFYKTNKKSDFIFSSEWNMFVPKDLLYLISKGVMDYD